MGLTAAIDDWLARLGSIRLHVLVAETPGSFAVRAAVERACARRGWVIALTPADADALVVCGAPEGVVAEAVDQLWSDLPGPRVRTEIGLIDAIEVTLTDLVAAYRAWDAKADLGSPAQPVEQDMADENQGGDDQGDDDQGGMDIGEMDMDMSGPGGIPLASGAEDRDGLEMDVLHLPLGPVLAGWPPGLMLTVTLQGDVIVAVQVRQIELSAVSDPTAFRLDAAAQLLGLAGAGVLAQRVGLARDAQLGLVPSGPSPAALRRGVEVSRGLRGALRGVGQVTVTEENGWPAEWSGDAYDRMLRLFGPAPSYPTSSVDDDVVTAALPTLLTGCELATARLTVASLWGLAQVTSSAGLGAPA